MCGCDALLVLQVQSTVCGCDTYTTSSTTDALLVLQVQQHCVWVCVPVGKFLQLMAVFPTLPQCRVSQATTTMAVCVWSVLTANTKTWQDRPSARTVRMVLSLPVSPDFLQASVLVSVQLRK